MCTKNRSFKTQKTRQNVQKSNLQPPHGTEVQDAAGDLAAFLKEAKASGTGSTEESPMPRRKPEIRVF